jgi:multiple sugar transport system ATP-binding protein
MNIVEATVERQNGNLVVQAGSQEIPVDNDTLAQHPALKAFEGRDIILGIRPEDLEDKSLAGTAEQGAHVRGTVQLTEALGSEVMVHFLVDAPPAITEDVKELAEDVGDDRVAEGVQPNQSVMVGRFGARSRVKPGDQIEVAVDTRQLHFFDPHTGLGIYHDAPEREPAAV